VAFGSRIRLPAATLTAALALTALSGCATAANQRGLTASLGGPHSPATGPAFGLTEDNADLLWSPDGPVRPYAEFQKARQQLTALHPRYVRLLVDWAALQPDPRRPPALAALVSGCARNISPCGAYAGIRDELAAIASQQRAVGNPAGDFQVVLDVFGTPAWAARAPSGCNAASASAFSRTPSEVAIAGYRALIRSLLALGAYEGVALEWWSPWNEPDDPAFISPQRASCTASSAPLSPALYAALARAMAAELRADGGDHHLLLGELNAFPTASADRTTSAQFLASLPDDVVCLSEVWSIHVYASAGPARPSADPVAALEQALDARGQCGRSARIWVTEAGAGARHPGSPRPPGAAAEQAGCVALGEQLMKWYRDSRVDAVFQYTFREDPAFPVGLVSPDLAHAYPTYRLWLAWARSRAAGAPPPAPDVACS
jgi:hypothetical protein